MPPSLQDQAAAEMLHVLRGIRDDHLPAGTRPKPGTRLAHVVQAIQRAEVAGIGAAPQQLAIPLARALSTTTPPQRDSKPARSSAEQPRRRRRRVEAVGTSVVASDDVMVDLKRASAELGVSESTIYRWARAQAVRTVVGPQGTRLYALADLKRIAAL